MVFGGFGIGCPLTSIECPKDLDTVYSVISQIADNDARRLAGWVGGYRTELDMGNLERLNGNGEGLRGGVD